MKYCLSCRRIIGNDNNPGDYVNEKAFRAGTNYGTCSRCQAEINLFDSSRKFILNIKGE